MQPSRVKASFLRRGSIAVDEDKLEEAWQGPLGRIAKVEKEASRGSGRLESELDELYERIDQIELGLVLLISALLAFALVKGFELTGWRAAALAVPVIVGMIVWHFVETHKHGKRRWQRFERLMAPDDSSN